MGVTVYKLINGLVDSGLLAKLSLREMKVLMVFMRHADANGQSFPGPELIAQRAGMDVRDVRRAIAGLIHHQILTGRGTAGRNNVAKRQLTLPENLGESPTISNAQIGGDLPTISSPQIGGESPTICEPVREIKGGRFNAKIGGDSPRLRTQEGFNTGDTDVSPAPMADATGPANLFLGMAGMTDPAKAKTASREPHRTGGAVTHEKPTRRQAEQTTANAKSLRKLTPEQHEIRRQAGDHWQNQFPFHPSHGGVASGFDSRDAAAVLKILRHPAVEWNLATFKAIVQTYWDTEQPKWHQLHRLPDQVTYLLSKLKGTHHVTRTSKPNAEQRGEYAESITLQAIGYGNKP